MFMHKNDVEKQKRFLAEHSLSWSRLSHLLVIFSWPRRTQEHSEGTVQKLSPLCDRQMVPIIQSIESFPQTDLQGIKVENLYKGSIEFYFPLP